MEIIIKTKNGQIVIKEPVASEFKFWLQHECFDAEPTEDLWEEFCWLENIIRPQLLDALSQF